MSLKEALLRDIYPTSGTYAHANGTSEDTALTLTITKKTKINNILLDLTNLTQNATIRTKPEIDGTNPKPVDTLNWNTADDDGVLLRGFVSDVDMIVTIQSVVAEGASRNIPYRVL